jgi:dolichyl-phosphate beta-glucosyltransferase
MLPNPKISLILPCFNEIEHIHESLPRILNYMSYVFPQGSFEVVLVEDCGTDGTREWLAGLRDGHVRVVLNKKNMGRGGAVKEGIRASRGSIIGFIDIDLEASESYLPKFVQSIEQGVDLAVGFRIYRVSWNPYVFVRHLLSVVYRFVLRNIVHCGVKDTEAGYKFFSRRFADYLVTQSKFDDWFFDTESTLLAELGKFKIVEIPIAFLRNTKKTSTVRVVSDSIKYLKAVAAFLTFKKNGRYFAPTVSSNSSTTDETTQTKRYIS